MATLAPLSSNSRRAHLHGACVLVCEAETEHL
jgi:hypothetical protein